MPVCLNNSKDTVANSLSVFGGNKTTDVLETLDVAQGLAPETLNSLEKPANAFHVYSKYFPTVATAISDKADKSATYSKSVVDILLGTNVDYTEMPNYATTATPYARTVLGDKFTDIINGSPDALNVLRELSDALGADANFSTTVLSKIHSKSNHCTVSSPLLLDFINHINPELLNVIADVSSKTEST